MSTSDKSLYKALKRYLKKDYTSKVTKSDRIKIWLVLSKASIHLNNDYLD